MGTVVKIDGIGQIIVKWDSGRNLSVIPGEDQFEIEDQKTLSCVFDTGWLPTEKETSVSFFVLQGFMQGKQGSDAGTLTTVRTAL